MRSSLRRLVLARFVSEAFATAALFVGVWGTATFKLHATPGQMALSGAVWGITSIAGSLVGGVLVDRLNPRRVLIIGEIIAIPATLSLITAESMQGLISLAIPVSLSAALITTAVASFPPFLTAGEAELNRINSRVEMAFAMAFVAGPAAGAFIAKVAGLDWIFVANAASSLLALLLLAGLRIRASATSNRESALAEMRDGIRVALRNRQVRVAFLIGLGVWLSFGSYMALEPLFYREVLHSGPALLGWVLTVFGGGVFTGAWLSGRIPKRYISLRTLSLLAIVIGFGEIAYTGTAHLPLVLAGNIVWGMALGAVTPIARTIIHARTPESHVGRVMGSMNIVQRIGMLIPLMFIGAIAAATGVQRVLVGAGVVLIVFALAVLPSARSADAGSPEEVTEIVPPAAGEPEPTVRGLL